MDPLPLMHASLVPLLTWPLFPLLRIAPAPAIAPRNKINYSFVPMSALHLSDMFSMPVGAALAPESTVELVELDAAFARVLIVGLGVRANAAPIVSFAGLV